jgi:uncharacterized membrane protein YadS
LSGTVVGFVAVVSFTLMVLTWLAAKRIGQRKVFFVAAAFGVHFVKSVVVAIALVTGVLEHEVLEMVAAVFDLGMVTLLFIPFWVRA